MLRQQRKFTIIDIIRGDRNCLDLLCRVAEKNLVCHLRQLADIYRDGDLPDLDHTIMLYDIAGHKWQRAELVSSRQIRISLVKESCISVTKLMNMNLGQATTLYKKITQL